MSESYKPEEVIDYWEKRHDAWNRRVDFGTSIFGVKDRWFEERFAHILPPRHLGEYVLDFGCGCGMYSVPLLRRYSHYIGLDTSATAIEIAKQYFSHQPGFSAWQLRNWPVELLVATGHCDLAITITVLQHQPIEWRLAAINEIKRVLKPNGRYVGLEMMGNTQAYDMPPMPEEDWIKAWEPLRLVKDEPADHPDWWADNVWYSV